MIGTIDVDVQAKFPNIPLDPMMAYVGSPSSIRVRNAPKRIGDWCIRSVEFTAVYPDGTVKSASCVLTGGVWVGTIEGTSTSGTSKNGYTIFASGTDENGNAVTGYILGKGDIEILEADGTLAPDPTRYYVKLLSAEAETPREGDMYPTEGGYVIWQNGQANQLGTPFEQITAYVDGAISGKADLSALELKQDKLSADQLYVIDREVYDLYTQIFTPTGSFRFLSPATLDKSVLIQQGILSQDGNTWLYSPQRVILGSSVVSIGSNTFKDAVILEKFEASNLGSIQSNAFNGCTRLNTVTIPNIANLGSYVFRYCSALKSLTLPKSLLTIGRYAFTDNSLDYVFFEGKTLAQVKAMANYDRWGLAEDKIYTNAFENQLPTKTSELSNDSGFITANDISSKADLSALDSYATKEEVSAKADLSTLSNYVPFDGSSVTIGTRKAGADVGTHTMAIGLNNTGDNLGQLVVGDSNTLNTPYSIIVGSSNNANSLTTNFVVGLANTVSSSNCGVAIGWNNSLSNANYAAAIGVQNTVSAALGITLGTRAHGDHIGSFVWAGQTATVPFQWQNYHSHGVGTFNINPVGGTNGFYIGTQSLSTILSSYAIKQELPTKTSELSNDSEYVTAPQLAVKRNITDMRARGVPQNTNSQSWFNIKYGTTTEDAWYYDEGRWETGTTLKVLATSTWQVFEFQKLVESQYSSLGTFSLDGNFEASITHEGVTYSITGYIGNLVTSDQLISQIAALEARIAALEGN